MIYNSSSDPVLIKKISLKIWSLRDEIESRINDKLAEGTSAEEVDLTQIHEQYTPKYLQNENVLSLKPNSELDTSEDEMLRAMAEEKSVVEGEVPAGEASSIPEDANNNLVELIPSANVVNIDKNIMSVSLVAPNIPEDKISKGKTVLAEINMDKMFFFCNRSFTEGQSIVIQFCIPKSFMVNADILYCRSFNLKSRIISQNNYTHRALIRFNFLKEGERALLRRFLQSIEPDIAKSEKKNDSSKDAGAGESDFGELDEFGL